MPHSAKIALKTIGKTVLAMVISVVIVVVFRMACLPNTTWKKLDAFRAIIRAGDVFDEKGFEARVRAEKWSFVRSKEGDHFAALADGPPMVTYLCDVWLKDNVVVEVKIINGAP